MTTTIVHDTTEAVKLCPLYCLYLKPIAKMVVSVALPQLKQPGKSISNWEVMERLKAMVHPDQFSALRISKSTMEFIRFEGEVENKGMVKTLLSKLDSKSIKLSGFTDILKIRAAENKVDFPTRHDWDAFFRDAKDMNETLPGERPDTIHLEGMPCKWFAQKDAGADKPSESILRAVFEGFGKIRNVDIPMLDPYREEMMDKNFHTFTFGGHLNFEAYVQYQEYAGFVKAMDSLRGMKLMYKGEDGKAVACNVKVTFDTTKHLSDLALKKRQLERQKLQELEKQREEQKRRERQEEERRREEERKQREQEEEEKERKREEKLRKREQKKKRETQKKVKKQQVEEQKKLHLKIAMEERKLLLAQRNLESIRLIAELLSRAKALKQQQREKEEAELARKQKEELARLQQLEERRRLQEAELRRVEEEKARALELQRKERELRERLLGNLLKNSVCSERQQEEPELPASGTEPAAGPQLNGLAHSGGGQSPARVSVPREDGLSQGSRPQRECSQEDGHERRRGRSQERQRSRSRQESSRKGSHGRREHSSDSSRSRQGHSRESSRNRRDYRREYSRESGHRRRECSRSRWERSRESSHRRRERSRSRREHSRGSSHRRRERSRHRRERSRRRRGRSHSRSGSSCRRSGSSGSDSSLGRRRSSRERRHRGGRRDSRGRSRADHHRRAS
ncbi:A-kinase anchor protein 17A [Brienomyrus brachyistius]|uniref:A-kinase anchor protein 17A n=1 Tax=Brienomyrus brachyistius TaxID=42636 RepID=UPI0020B34CFF|nr:A-kinase anchor protein 17A [Brienomyrus brachyistius]XP_048880925.1 A-kinase anchor protein 17A [Brienomyrus brachyistius]